MILDLRYLVGALLAYMPQLPNAAAEDQYFLTIETPAICHDLETATRVGSMLDTFMSASPAFDVTTMSPDQVKALSAVLASGQCVFAPGFSSPLWLTVEENQDGFGEPIRDYQSGELFLSVVAVQVTDATIPFQNGYVFVFWME